MKVAAVLLGAGGIGLAGLYTNLIQTAAAMASLGIGSAGTRQIAHANATGGEIAVSRTRLALFWGAVVLAIAGAISFWVLSGWIARTLLADESRAGDVAWLSIGVALTVGSASQSALLVGMRRIGDLARISLGAGVIGSALGVLALWLWGPRGLIIMVLIAPAVTFLLGHSYTARLAPPCRPTSFSEVAQEWLSIVQLGLPLMLSGVVTMLGQLAVRILVQRELGPVALGQFQAAWTIGVAYLGFVLGAMGSDYYPRLTASIHDAAQATRLVNEQTEVALLLCAPILLGMLGIAPWVIPLLYSADFTPAVEVVRWQLMADVFKVMGWPLAFVIAAQGGGKTFLATESFAAGVFVIGVFFGLPLFGITGTGVALLALYSLYLPLVWWIAKRRIGFQWTNGVIATFCVLVISAAAVHVASRWSERVAAGLSTGLAIAMGGWALFRLSAVAGATGRLGSIAAIGEKLTRCSKRGI